MENSISKSFFLNIFIIFLNKQAETEANLASEITNEILGELKFEDVKNFVENNSNKNNNDKQVLFEKKAYFLPEITKTNKNLSRNEFFKQKKHFFIMCEGGKPIYSRYGDYLEHCGIFATFSAIATKLTHFNNSNNFSEKLQ